MHRTDHSRFRKRTISSPDFSHAERRTRIVIGITAAMMVVEIAAGTHVALNGFAGRRLAHEHACPRVPHSGRGVLFQPNTSRQCAFQFRHGKNRGARRIHRRGRARDCGVPDGGRISSPALCSTGNTLQRSHRNRLPWLVGESGLRSPAGGSPPRTRRRHAHDHDLNLRAAYLPRPGRCVHFHPRDHGINGRQIFRLEVA